MKLFITAIATVLFTQTVFALQPKDCAAQDLQVLAQLKIRAQNQDMSLIGSPELLALPSLRISEFNREASEVMNVPLAAEDFANLKVIVDGLYSVPAHQWFISETRRNAILRSLDASKSAQQTIDILWSLTREYIRAGGNMNFTLKSFSLLTTDGQVVSIEPAPGDQIFTRQNFRYWSVRNAQATKSIVDKMTTCEQVANIPNQESELLRLEQSTGIAYTAIPVKFAGIQYVFVVRPIGSYGEHSYTSGGPLDYALGLQEYHTKVADKKSSKKAKKEALFHMNNEFTRLEFWIKSFVK